MAQIDETTNRLIGMLIQVLRSENSSNRELAVVQLVLFGEKAVSPLVSYLKNEDELEGEVASVDYAYRVANTSMEKSRLIKASQSFKERWGREFYEFANPEMAAPRFRAEQGALKALSLLGMDNQLKESFPNIFKKIEDHKSSFRKA